MNCWMNEAPGQPLAGPDSRPMQNGVRPSAAAAVVHAGEVVECAIGRPVVLRRVVPDEPGDRRRAGDAVQAVADRGQLDERRREVGFDVGNVDDVVEGEQFAGARQRLHLPGARDWTRCRAGCRRRGAVCSTASRSNVPSYSIEMPVASSNGAKALRNASKLSPPSTPSTLIEPPISASASAAGDPPPYPATPTSRTLTTTRAAFSLVVHLDLPSARQLRPRRAPRQSTAACPECQVLLLKHFTCYGDAHIATMEGAWRSRSTTSPRAPG